jgi:hypothetical protein
MVAARAADIADHRARHRIHQLPQLLQLPQDLSAAQRRPHHGRGARSAAGDRSGLNVGLAPRSNTQLATSLTIAKDHTDGVRFAVVIDQMAKRLVEVGEAAANQDWLRRLQRVGEIVSWLGEDDDTYQVGLPFRNSFGVIVGAVVLGYDKAAIDRATAAMGFALFVDWIQAVVLMTALTVLGIWWLTRGLGPS